FGPLAVLCWATVAPSSWRMRTWKGTRQLIRLHAVIALLTTVAGRTLGSIYAVFGIFALGSVLMDATILGFSSWVEAGDDELRTYRNAQVKIAGSVVAAITLWSFAHIGFVIWQAQLISDGKPYCLLVADRVGYRTAQSLIDLNGMKMRVPADTREPSYHAVLVVDHDSGREWRNWSYLLQHFVRIDPPPAVWSRVRSTCQPRDNFAFQLPLW